MFNPKRNEINLHGNFNIFDGIDSLPLNQSTLFGYSFEIALGNYISEAYFLASGSLLVLFISMCLHHKTFSKMLRFEASILDHRNKSRNDIEHLSKMICFHVSVKR